MIGLGIDLCQVERIEKAIAAHANFLSRYYTEEEQAYIAQRGSVGAQSAAAMFAAKEALLKAMGIGLSSGISLREIGVCHDTNGAPCYKLTGAAADRLRSMGGGSVFLSLTHEGGMAAAVAVIDRRKTKRRSVSYKQNAFFTQTAPRSFERGAV